MSGKNRSERARVVRADKQTESRKVASASSDAVFASMDERASEQFFGKRGFSTGTVKALIVHGIELPEELLFMPIEQVKRISGPGKSGLAELRAYRKRFRRHDD